MDVKEEEPSLASFTAKVKVYRDWTIVLTPEAEGKTSEENIIAWCKEQMAAYKIPTLIEFVDQLPKSPTGKLMWRALQEEEWEAKS